MDARGGLPTPATVADDDGLAAELRGFGALGILAIVVVLAGNALFRPLSALLVLAWAWRSRTPWRAIGFARPRGWAVTVVAGVALGVLLKLAMKAVVMPLLGADPINRTYHYLVGNRAAIPTTLYLLIVGAGFGEEVVFRGFFFERLGRLLGPGGGAKGAIVLVTAALFGLAHYADQGLAGAEPGAITGLVFGAVYAATGRLWVPMIAHAAFDLTAYAIIYWDVEGRVARLVFG